MICFYFCHLEFIPCAIMVVLWVYWMFSIDDFFMTQKWTTKLILCISGFLVIFRAFFSGMAHLMHCVSSEYSRIWWNIDYISILIFSGMAAMIWIHFIFYCDSKLQIMFVFALLAFMTTTVCTVVLTTQDTLREVSLVITIFFNNVFIWGYLLISILLKTTDVPWQYALYWFISIIVAVIGAIFRTTEYPETYFVKKNVKNRLQSDDDLTKKEEQEEQQKELTQILRDLARNKSWYFYFSTSHNWWHIFVNTVTMINILIWKSYLIWRADNQC